MKILMTKEEMPVDCADCPFSHYEYTYFQCIVLPDGLNKKWHEDRPYKKLKKCPIQLDE